MVRKTIGKPVPALIGNKLKCYYRQTEDMLECVCDVHAPPFTPSKHHRNASRPGRIQGTYLRLFSLA
jgi:hypothetical protein